ncbi:sensor histidine kinase [Paenibacillus koleovorans]|uniref:sensor histidine kinase n=1 Tax=Paenibacillus koleovorans TaxID=121608 RepID=UPI001FE9FB1D|nr:HAMP domain-containing sensor histidine kinase [Paenibacillus koleovorans]
MNEERPFSGREIAAKVVMVVFMISFCWSIAFLIISFLFDHYQKPRHWEEMLARGSTIAALYEADRSGNPDETVRQVANLRNDLIMLADEKGNRKTFGPGSGTVEATPAEVNAVLAGDTLKKLPRHNPFQHGVATTGQSLLVNGKPHALFIQIETSSLFQDYGKQLLTILLAFTIMSVTAALMSLRHRRKHPIQTIVEAMRRMAKGDFDVKLDADPRRGPFGAIAKSLNDMAEELSEMEKMRQEFISNVSHEIQSPLTSISGFTRALYNEQLERNDRLRYLSIIETESKRLSRLSDNLLKLTSLESQHHPFERRRFRLDKHLRTIVLACEPQWVEKEIEMDVSLEALEIAADEALLSQVWINLINNSIKFTPHGGTIGISLEREEHSAVVRIWDTGPGIPEEDRPHVFERFYKADKSRTRTGTSVGSGLGLSIVKKIIDMHGGTVTVGLVNGQGSGALFTVKLPLPATREEKGGLLL